MANVWKPLVKSEDQIDGLTTFKEILEVCNHQHIHIWLPLQTLKLAETHNLPTSLQISTEPTMLIGRTR
ncbi:hypothetical protein GQ457_10G013880 [Hibiscus cannabinus]